MLRSLLALLLAALPLGAAEIVTLAGNGQKGFTGDGGQASAAQINAPFGLVRAPDGALYFCDTDNQRVRKITPDGKIATVAGSGEKGYAGDGGPALQAKMNEPYEVRFDAAGDLYIVERLSAVVRKVTLATGVISTVAGKGTEGFSGDGGPAAQAQMKQPHSIVFDQAGDLYICDIGNHRIRKVTMKTGVITTFAGTGEKKPATDGGPIAGTPLSGPRAMDFDAAGNLWLALREGNAIYRLELGAGKLHLVAGTGKSGFTGNGGPAKEATLSGPKGISVGPDGDIYFADTESHTIRKVALKTGTVELVAGTGKRGDGPEGDPLKCALNRPHGIFVEKDGTILIGDSETHRVRAVRKK